METYHLQSHDSKVHFTRILASVAMATIIIVGITVASILWLPNDVVARNVWLGSEPEILLSGNTPQSLTRILENHDASLPEYTVTLVDPMTQKTWQKNSQELGLTWDTNHIQASALAVGRSGNFWEQMYQRWQQLSQKSVVLPAYQYKSEPLEAWINEISEHVSTNGRLPTASYTKETILIDSGELGYQLDRDRLIEELDARAGAPSTITIAVEQTITPLSADGLITSQQRLAGLSQHTISLTSDDPADQPIILTSSEFFPWLDLPTGVRAASLSAGLIFHTQTLEREPQNATFTLETDTNELVEFVPHRNGRSVSIDLLANSVTSLLAQIEAQNTLADSKQETPATQTAIETDHTLPIPFIETEPETTLEEVNSLGITERIGVGYSTFHHSIPNRVHNVALTSERMHATLIMTGEEFSFNKSVGEISRRTGYKTAYVIRNGRTELGDGGGVCQVSTTVFRAALNAGLPITKWKPHSYRVGYYEQNTEPGFDATVYSPSVDFRFENDTPHAIVVATQVDVNNRALSIELWGTSDGRTAEISDYRIWNQRSAPAPQYIEDPTLPKGTVKQIDWSAAGASTEFSYRVKNADGSERIARTFRSNFQPWKAVYLVGTR